MKFVVAGAESNDCQTHNIAHTLRKMGHEVVSLTERLWRIRQNRWARLLNTSNFRINPWQANYEKQLLNLCIEEKPDVVMFGTATVEPATVMQLKRSTGAATVCWYTDPPANLKRLHCLRGEYDLLYFKDPHFAQSLTKQFGLKTSHLEEACNSDWHKPIQDCSINNGILVAGSFYGYRVKMIEVLSDAGIDLMGYGPPPPKWSGSKVRTVYSGLYLNEQNKALYFSSALACLNTFSPRESLSSLNCRVFEICGCGGLMLTEPRPALARCFEPESEYLEFDSQEDCLEKIRYLRENPEQAKAIRARAAKRAHKDHTYEKRLNVILDDLNAL